MVVEIATIVLTSKIPSEVKTLTHRTLTCHIKTTSKIIVVVYKIRLASCNALQLDLEFSNAETSLPILACEFSVLDNITRKLFVLEEFLQHVLGSSHTTQKYHQCEKQLFSQHYKETQLKKISLSYLLQMQFKIYEVLLSKTSQIYPRGVRR